MIRLHDLKVREDFTKEELLAYACQKGKIHPKDVKDIRIYKKSIDARDKKDVFYITECLSSSAPPISRK